MKGVEVTVYTRRSQQKVVATKSPALTSLPPPGRVRTLPPQFAVRHCTWSLLELLTERSGDGETRPPRTAAVEPAHGRPRTTILYKRIVFLFAPREERNFAAALYSWMEHTLALFCFATASNAITIASMWYVYNYNI